MLSKKQISACYAAAAFPGPAVIGKKLSVAGFMWYKGSNLGLHSCRASSPAACGTREAEARVGGHTRHKRRPCLVLKAIILKRWRCASKYNLRRELQTSVRHHTLLTLKFAGVRILTLKNSLWFAWESGRVNGSAEAKMVLWGPRGQCLSVWPLPTPL